MSSSGGVDDERLRSDEAEDTEVEGGGAAVETADAGAVDADTSAILHASGEGRGREEDAALQVPSVPEDRIIASSGGGAQSVADAGGSTTRGDR